MRRRVLCRCQVPLCNLPANARSLREYEMNTLGRGADETDTTEKHENSLSSSARGQVSVGVGRSPGLRVNASPRPSRSCGLQWLSEGARRLQLRGQPRSWA